MTQAKDSVIRNKEEAAKTAEVFGSKGRKVVDKDTGHEFPARIMYLNKQLKFQKTGLWYLQTLQNLTLAELTEYRTAYSKDLSMIETEVIGLLLKAASGDREAKGLLYDANKQLFNATKQIYIEEMRQQVRQPEGNRLDALLEQIGDAVVAEDKA